MSTIDDLDLELTSIDQLATLLDDLIYEGEPGLITAVLERFGSRLDGYRGNPPWQVTVGGETGVVCENGTRQWERIDKQMTYCSIDDLVDAMNAIDGSLDERDRFEDFGEVEAFVAASAGEWATLGDPADCVATILVTIGGSIYEIDWDPSGSRRDFQWSSRIGCRSATELVGTLNRVAYEEGGGFPFIIRAAVDAASDLGGGRWLVAFEGAGGIYREAAIIAGTEANSGLTPTGEWLWAIERELTHEELREFTELLKTGFPGELIAAAFGPAGRQLR
jgi:hypothetical protein